MTKICYSFDKHTRLFAGARFVYKDPKTGLDMTPAYATSSKPTFEKGKITRFIDGAWRLETPEPEVEKIPTFEEVLGEKKIELKRNRSSALSNAVGKVKGLDSAFSINQDMLVILQAKMNSLTYGSDTTTLGDSNKNRVNLNKEQYLSLIAQACEIDSKIFELYSVKFKKLVSLDKKKDLKKLKNFNTELNINN